MFSFFISIKWSLNHCLGFVELFRISDLTHLKKLPTERQTTHGSVGEAQGLDLHQVDWRLPLSADAFFRFLIDFFASFFNPNQGK
jgi:hypothetical protein